MKKKLVLGKENLLQGRGTLRGQEKGAHEGGKLVPSPRQVSQQEAKRGKTRSRRGGLQQVSVVFQFLVIFFPEAREVEVGKFAPSIYKNVFQCISSYIFVIFLYLYYLVY